MRRIWHDDVRACPPGWWPARTNGEAIGLLVELRRALEISMDRDMGDGQPTGEALCVWLVDNPDYRPDVITIHSANAPAAQRMRNILLDGGCRNVRMRPNGGIAR